MSVGLNLPPWARVAVRYGVGLGLALCLLALIGLLRGPQATLDALREATVRRDTAEIARRIDGPALRQSLGRLLLQQMGTAMPDDGGDNRKLLSQFIISGALVRPLVESLLTPEGLAALLDGQIAPRRMALPSGVPGAGTAPLINTRWRNLSTVGAAVMTPAGDALLVLVLHRDGLTWRLAGVETEAPAATVSLPR
jgi:hypothetical protein